MKALYFLIIAGLIACTKSPESIEDSLGNRVTHGPMLGHVTESSVRIWARTNSPGTFEVTYWIADENSTKHRMDVSTSLQNDNAGWATIEGLKPGTQYEYEVSPAEDPTVAGGSFKTLPSADEYSNTYNPDGLFNFSFEYGSCANQNPKHGIGPSLPTYTTMLEQIQDDVHFAVMNGDWLYEENRDFPVSGWLQQQNIDEPDKPQIVEHAPTVVGVWENYKTYLSRAGNLSEWHRNVPSYFTFDDHELINDIWGSGSVGRRDRRAVFRDIGTAAWYDYLGWANPVDFTQDIHFGTAQFSGGSDLLKDPNADFTALDYDEMANLHIHWGTPTAGVDDTGLDVDSTGNPNSKIYEIKEVVDKNTLRINPAVVADGEASYSIGRKSYAKYSIANSDFFLLDTRTHREYHDTQNRDKPGLTILGDQQREWLMEEMKNSDADFFFLFSSVPFVIPHIGAGGYAAADNKDESWTVFLDEREKLISFWEELDKPVFVLTGDLHNSFAVKITDKIWEFCSGPHNSVNHRLSDEGNRPKTGLFTFIDREVDIRWSSFAMDDIPREERNFPHYCVVKINNVFNNPLEFGGERWVAYEHPQVIFQYYDGRTGEFRYSETISTSRNK